MSRLSSIIDDDGTTLASYQYMGADAIVRAILQPAQRLPRLHRPRLQRLRPLRPHRRAVVGKHDQPDGPVPGEPVPRRGRDVCLGRLGRLASVAEPNSRGGTTTFAYSYDGTGRLVGTTTTVAGPHGGGRVTASADNYYAGSQLIETDVSDGTVYQYVWSARAADPILRDTIAGPHSGDRYYYLSDANGNVTAVTDTGGNVLERYFYLCPCQLGAVKIFRLAAGRPSPGVGRSSLAHSSMAA